MKVLQERPKLERREVDSILEMIDIRTGVIQTLHRFPYCVEAPVWTRDGRFLVYNALGRIHTYSIKTGISQTIDTGFAGHCNGDHAYSPDGQRIAVGHHTREDGRARIYIMPISGGIPVLITPIGPSYLHGWSPDGTLLVYCAKRNGIFDIYTIPSDGGEETRMTQTPGVDDSPEYTPDGAHIWFCSSRGGTMQLYRMRADGSGQTQMTFDEGHNWFPHISPDGQHVAFLTYRPDEVPADAHAPDKHVRLRMMSIGGGDISTLAAFVGGQGSMNANAWAPDSQRLAFVRYEPWQ